MDLRAESVSRSFRGLATTASFASLFVYAMALSITPASNNQLALAYSASLGQLGILPLAVMLGFISTVMWAGRLSDRYGKLPMVTAGCVAMSVGAFIFAKTTSFNIAVLAAALMGIGGGLSESTAMALLADLYSGSRRTSMMNFSQALFGLGAVAAPLGMGMLLSADVSWRWGYIGTGIACALATAIALAALAMRQERPIRMQGQEPPWLSVLFDKWVLLLSVGIMLYVGAEIGQSNWLAVYYKRVFGSGDSLAASSLSFMWMGIGVGRVLGAQVSKLLTDVQLIRFSLVTAAVFQGALLLVDGPITGAIATFGLGLALGPVFPTIVSRAGAIHPNATGTVMAIVIAFGALGGAIFAPTIGWLADGFGLQPALWTCFVLLVINAGIFLVMRDNR